jgi:hypothetical protein
MGCAAGVLEGLADRNICSCLAVEMAKIKKKQRFLEIFELSPFYWTKSVV